ncbi:MAG: DUF1587 domain-containing protein, partial [Planctomycetota bacterium]
MNPFFWPQLTATRHREHCPGDGAHAPRSRSLTVAWLVAFGFACLSQATALWPPAPLLAGETLEDAAEEFDSFDGDEDNDAEEHEEERDAEDVEDEETEFEESEIELRLGELLGLREDVARREPNGREEQIELQDCVASLDEAIAVVRQWERLQRAMDDARQWGAEANVERLLPELERVALVAEARDRLLHLQIHHLEIHAQIEEALRDQDDRRRALLDFLQRGLREGKELAHELLQARLKGSEFEASEIADELDFVVDERVHPPLEALDLRVRIDEAEEEGEDELVDELREELRELEESINVDRAIEEHSPKDEVRREPEASPTSVMQPVLVTKETLAPCADMDLQRDVRPLLQKYCFDCHSSDFSSGELDFEQLLALSPIVKNRRQWINVIEQTKNHVMPPEDSEQPTQDERKKIVLSLHNAVFNFDYSQIDDPGYEAARRLTHREYSNTVRDLFGVEIDVTDRFPADLTATSGFDNSANTLFIQPLLMERYIGLAEHVVAVALPD